MKTLRFFEEAAHGLVGKFMMMLLLLGGVSARIYAENGAWAKYDAQTSTLTFTYGEKPTGDNVYDAGDTSNNFPGWHKIGVREVVFDESFKYARPKSCDTWFDEQTSLTSIEGMSNLNTSEVTNMKQMFYNCKKLTSLDLSSFNTEKATDMTEMFGNCIGLTSLDLSSFNTTQVTFMNGMFRGCSGLSSLDLSSFNTAQVTNMNEMFEGCNGLTSLDLSSFNTAQVAYMNDMFNGCSGLTSLDLSSFQTYQVTNMEGMFNGCSKLTSLDLSSFQTHQVTNMEDMFNGCSELTRIYVSNYFVTNKAEYSSNMFAGCISLAGYDESRTDKQMANYQTGYLTAYAYAVYNKANATLTFVGGKKKADVEEESTVYNANDTGDKTTPGWCKMGAGEVKFDESFQYTRPKSCHSWFSDMDYLKSITGISNLNTSEVTDMSEMFNGCSELTSLDLTSFNTAQVTDMSYMFNGCSKLTSLDLTSFNTAQVTDMSYMFSDCKGLTLLDLSSFNTAQVTDMEGMFTNCNVLTSLDLTSFNTVQVTNMEGMFNNCQKLTSLDLSSFNTEQVTSMESMFSECYNLANIYVSDKFVTDKIQDPNNMFFNCKKLTNFDASKIGNSMANYNNGYFKTYYKIGDQPLVELYGENLAVDNLTLTDGKDFVAHAPFAAAQANYSRTGIANKWGTLCLPFAINMAEETRFRAFSLDSKTNDVVELTEITGAISAGTPVIIKMNEGITEISFSEKEVIIVPTAQSVSNTDESLLTVGLLQKKTFTRDDDDCFIVKNNMLMNPSGLLGANAKSVSAKAYRAYVKDNTPAEPNMARAFKLSMGDEPTGIDEQESFMNDKAEYYDLQGRRINDLQKGVNIVKCGNKATKVIVK